MILHHLPDAVKDVEAHGLVAEIDALLRQGFPGKGIAL
jgi:hypothetical protein